MKHKTPILQRADFFPQNIRRNRYNEQLNSVIFIAYPGLVGTMLRSKRKQMKIDVRAVQRKHRKAKETATSVRKKEMGRKAA